MKAALRLLPVLVVAVWLTPSAPLRGDGHQAGPAQLPPPATGTMDFATDIRPILERSCVRCHATPEVIVTRYLVRNKGGLSLSSREEALRGGDLGVVIVPGKSEESPLIRLVSGIPIDYTPPMPPGERDRLSREEVGKLRAWIDQGAVWPQ